MKLLKIIPESPNDNYIQEAVEALERGELIILPTDTVYAVGCDVLSNKAVEKICNLKGIKSSKNTLSILCKNISQCSEYARIDDISHRLMHDYLPGPYTFILPALSKLPRAFKGRRTVGVRICDNNVVESLLERFGRPIMVSSVPIEEEDDVEPEFMARRYNGVVSLILDSGRGDTEGSTVVDSTDIDTEIIRQGKGLL